MTERDLEFFANTKSKYFKVKYEQKIFRGLQKKISDLK